MGNVVARIGGEFRRSKNTSWIASIFVGRIESEFCRSKNTEWSSSMEKLCLHRSWISSKRKYVVKQVKKPKLCWSW